MDYRDLCDKIFMLNEKIRFAGILSDSGDLLAGGMRPGVKPLNNEVNRRRWLNQISICREMNSMFDQNYGSLKYTFNYRTRVKQLIFYIGRDTLFISIDPSVSVLATINIAESVLRYIEEDMETILKREMNS